MREHSIIIYNKIYCLLITLCFLKHPLPAQSYDIVIKGGHVIDAKNNIDAVMDVAIKDGKIVQLAKNIDAKQATQAVDAKGGCVGSSGPYFRPREF